MQGRLENLSLLSFGQTTITLEVFRDMYNKLNAEKDQMIKDAIAATTDMLQNQLVPERNSTLTSPSATNPQR